MSESTSSQVVVWDGTALSVREVPCPVRADSTVLDVVASGVCGTDLHVLAHGAAATPEAPLSLGHEVLARVRRVGPATPVVGGGELAEGDLVVVVPGIACGACSMCLSFGAHEHLCPQRIVHGFSRFDTGGGFPIGGYASRLELADDVAVIRVPDGMPWQRAVLGELVSVAVRAVERALGQGRPDIGMGTLVGGVAAVLGAGPVGVTVALVLRAAGLEVVVHESHPWRVRYAADELGLDVRSTGSAGWVAEAVGATPRDLGYDVVVECGGTPELFADALALARPGGRVVELGHFVPNGTVAVDPSVICRKDLDVVGSVLAPPTAYPKAMRLLARPDIPFDRVVTDQVALDRFTDLDLLLGERDYLKRVLRPTT